MTLTNSYQRGKTFASASFSCTKAIACAANMLLSLPKGCSKKAEPPRGESAEQPSVASPSNPDSSPSEYQQADAKPATESPTRDELPTPTTSRADIAQPKGSLLPDTPRSPAEIAQMLKSTRDKQVALDAIGQYTTNNPHPLGEMSALLGNYNASLVDPVLKWLIQNDSNAGINEAAQVALQNAAGRGE